jgi:hypothetical protein
VALSDSYFTHYFQQLIAAGKARTCALEYAALGAARRFLVEQFPDRLTRADLVMA